MTISSFEIAITATGAPVMFAIGIYLYGDAAADFVAEQESKFQSWMTQTFFDESQMTSA